MELERITSLEAHLVEERKKNSAIQSSYQELEVYLQSRELETSKLINKLQNNEIFYSEKIKKEKEKKKKLGEEVNRLNEFVASNFLQNEQIKKQIEEKELEV